MNLSIIIPNYNGEEILRKNLPQVFEAVKNYNKGRVEIIIADDPSTDNSLNVINEFLISLKGSGVIGKKIENKDKAKAGFSKNVKRGVTISTGEILILLNTDVFPHKDFLIPLISHFEDQRVFAVGCMDESIEDGKIVLRGCGVGRWEKGFLQHNARSVDSKNTLWASGGSSAFRKSVWERLGGFNELYNPFYWEDIDLSYRARKAGYNILFEKKAVVVHDHGKGAIKTSQKKFIIKKTAYRNQFYFVWLNITDLDLLFSHLFWLGFHFLAALKRRDWAYFAGFSSALLHLPIVFACRFQTVSNFVITDKQVLSEFK